MHNKKVDANRRILIIEDDESLATLLAVLLTRNGFSVWVAPTGKEGLLLAEQYNCDLILSDIDLPDLDGFEICRHMKASSKYQQVPLVLMSGRHPEENEKKAFKYGAVDFLAKPFQVDELVNRLTRHIKTEGNGVL
jgi:DNA-binding response OmpR family regulator